MQLDPLVNRIKPAKLAKYFAENLPLRARLFNGLGFTGAAIGVVVAGTSIFTGAGVLHASLNLAASLFAAFLIYYANKTGRFEMCYDITIALVFFGLFGGLFFTAGGYRSGIPSFFVFAPAFTAMMLRGKKRIAVISAEMAFYCTLCLIQYRNPGLVPPYPSEGDLAFDIAFGFALSSAALVGAMGFAFRAYDGQTAKLSAFLSKMSRDIRESVDDMNCMGDMGELTECLVMARDSSKNLADEIDALVAISRAGHGQDDKHESEYESPGMSPSQILITLLENHMTDISNLHELLEAERNAAALEIDEEKFEALTSRLSEKDKELARFMLLGGTNKAIIETLPYSPKYVSKLTKKIIHTIGVKNRAEFREIVLKIKH